MKKLMYAALLLAVVLAGCAGASQPKTEITIVATDFSYTPNPIYVPLGEEVTITFQNDGQVEHDFVSAEMSVANVVVDNMDEHMDVNTNEHMDENMDEHMDENTNEHMGENMDEHMDENANEHMEEEMPVDEHAMHGAEYAIHTSTKPGTSTVLKFTPLEAGEYEILCTVEGHKEAGMVATLIVVAQE